MTVAQQTDALFVLVADNEMEQTLKSVLNRPESLGIRRLKYRCIRHPNRDNGCRTNAAQFLRSFLQTYNHSIVIFDRVGCGSEKSRTEIERDVDLALRHNGWGKRGRSIVIDPELEAWLWTSSPVVLKSLGWSRGYEELKSWLVNKELWNQSSSKPLDPKEALIQTLKRTRQKRSARLYGKIASSVSLQRCEDPAFCKLKRILRKWYGL